MNKKEFEEYLDSLDLDKKEYCIISGGSLLMHNLKEETDDVDLYVTQNSFDKLSKKFNVHISGKPFPNHYTVAVLSPKLNKKGNSFYGLETIERLTTETSLSIL